MARIVHLFRRQKIQLFGGAFRLEKVAVLPSSFPDSSRVVGQMPNNTIHSCKKNSQFGGCMTVTSATISRHLDVQSLLKLLQYDLGCGCIVFHIIITKMSYICMFFFIHIARTPEPNNSISTIGHWALARREARVGDGACRRYPCGCGYTRHRYLMFVWIRPSSGGQKPIL